IRVPFPALARGDNAHRGDENSESFHTHYRKKREYRWPSAAALPASRPSAPDGRNLLSLRACFGQSDGDRLFAAFHRPALAALPATHGALDVFARTAAVSARASRPSRHFHPSRLMTRRSAANPAPSALSTRDSRGQRDVRDRAAFRATTRRLVRLRARARVA